ncbi:hypothetical protein EV188_113113 [Actinomycetospora succinea]|uniref:Uncharacterized protein n=1 Tax=Actinomycetospora succinea TaxID=663603 RepID=A0A4R6UK77_9PSEU|nr:hypothetical protein [Actinomycetospora succinea]TDQ47368.1 hypothetical protein EV188_113113 [Actinomycetospora succinea]
MSDLVVHLGRPEDLVTVEPADLLDDDLGRTIPGAEEMFEVLLARRRPRRGLDRIVMTLPPGVVADGDVEAVRTRLADGLRRWCLRRLESVARDAGLQRRLAVAALRPGIPLFLIGLAFSTDFLAPDVPEFFQNLLGNGVFLVIAWIGLWYPLDSLFFARLPLKRQRRALVVLMALPVEVHARPWAERVVARDASGDGG